MRGLLALLLFAFGIPSARADTAPLALQRTIVNTGGAQAQVCLRFDGKLSADVEAHYADYVTLRPVSSPAIEARDHDLCLSGLAFGQSYDITLRAGLRAADGRSLPADRALHVALADRSPLVAISGSGFILSRQTSTGLVIDSVNVPRVRVHVLRMSARMLATNPSTLADPGQTVRAYSLIDIVRHQAQLVWSGTMDVRSDRNQTVQTAFPIAQVIQGKPPGAYLVLAENAARPKSRFFSDKIEDSDDWPDDIGNTEFAAHWLVSTDLALTSFDGRDGLHVFVRSLASARPVAGVTLTLLSVGLDTLQTVTTGPDGGATFPAGLLRGHGAMRARTLTALTQAGDYTTASLDRPAFDFSDRGVSGRPAGGPVQAFIATDRGIYRPGETIRLTTLMRDRRGDAMQAGSTLTVRRPDGVAFRTIVLPSEPDGGTATSVTLTGSAARGHWTAELCLDPGEPAIGTAGFEVQDFVPQQLAVHVTGVPSRLSPDAKLAFDVDGRFLYGAPAAGLHAEATLRVARDDAPVADAPRGYAFGIADETVDEDEQTLDVPDADDHGHAAASDSFEVPATVSVPLKATLIAGLFEPSGRLVSDTASFHIRNQAMLIGVRARVPAGFADQTQASFDVLTYDGDARPAAASGLQWSLIRENRVFDWFDTDGNWTFHYHAVDEPIASGTLDDRGGQGGEPHLCPRLGPLPVRGDRSENGRCEQHRFRHRLERRGGGRGHAGQARDHRSIGAHRGRRHGPSAHQGPVRGPRADRGRQRPRPRDA